MGMFDNFPNKNIPDNRPRYTYDDDTGEIIIGGTCTHIFKLPFKYSEIANDFDIIYKQGLTKVLTKRPIDCTITENHCMTVVKVILSVEDTQLFNSSLLSTMIQIKILTKTNEIIYSDPHTVVVKSPLDNTGGV